LDDAPYEEEDKPGAHFHDFDRHKRAVSRDLEALLNTRREPIDNVADFPALQRSLLMYGLPDFSAMSLKNDADRARIIREVEATVSLFEPRLARVRVTLETSAEATPTLQFRIDALLRVDPAPEPVTFDALLNVSTQHYQIRA
jgi:type VI secretion system protein ImpF